MANIGSLGNNLPVNDLNQTRKPASPKTQEQANNVSDGVSLGGKQDTTAVDKKKWTILLYSAADNNLESALTADVAELEAVGSNKNMNVLVQLDRGEKPSGISGGWEGCKRFYLNGDNDTSMINSPSLKDMGQVNMADPKELADFVEWGIKNYPAENYMLVMSDHGMGWFGALEDESHKGWMSMPMIEDALKTAQKATGEKINVIGLDACLMGGLEPGYQLREVADYMVASQNTEGAEGWPYLKIFTSKLMKEIQRSLDSKFTISPEQVAKKAVNDSAGFSSISTLSAIDLSQMKYVAEATDDFARAIMSTDTSMVDLRKIARSTKQWHGFSDQIDFAERIMKDPTITDENLKEAAEAMINAVSDAVIAEYHSPGQKGANGLSLEISPNGGDKAATIKGNKVKYGDLAFAKDTLWDEAMGPNGLAKGYVPRTKPSAGGGMESMQELADMINALIASGALPVEMINLPPLGLVSEGDALQEQLSQLFTNDQLIELFPELIPLAKANNFIES